MVDYVVMFYVMLYAVVVSLLLLLLLLFLTVFGMSPLTHTDAGDCGEQEGETSNNQNGDNQGADGEGLLVSSVARGRVARVVAAARLIAGRRGFVARGWRVIARGRGVVARARVAGRSIGAAGVGGRVARTARGGSAMPVRPVTPYEDVSAVDSAHGQCEAAYEFAIHDCWCCAVVCCVCVFCVVDVAAERVNSWCAEC